MASEDTAVVRLRALIGVIFGLGIAAAALGRGEMRFFVICFFIPGGWAYAVPRWPAIVIWIMWASTIGMLGVLLALGNRPTLFTVPEHWLMAVAAALLYVAVPVVRRLHDVPRPLGRRSGRIPEARVVRRDT